MSSDSPLSRESLPASGQGMAPPPLVPRRHFLSSSSGSLASVALAWLLAREVSARAPKQSPTGAASGLHFPAKAKRVVQIFCSGGVSHLETFDPKPELDLRFEEIETMAGHVPVPDAAAALLEAFPAASAAFGAERIAGLACSSFLVGMVCPGLHSIYRNLTLALTPAQADALCFRVRYAAADYRFVRLAVSGAGWSGQIDTNVRPEPAAQAGLADLANRVVANEFAGISALILGGSRGLGELTANILAAGGAHVMLTYAMGEADARRVQADIIAGGGRCDVVHYDVGKPASDQVGNLPRLPDQLYYMATPKIFRRQEAVFSAANFQEFLTFYVTAFADLCNELRARASSEISVFYPSSVSIDDRPANMTEYTMAKAAGEVLCADMTSFGRWQRLLVRRLPRLPTDQTATLFEADDADPVETMLPIVREMRITP